MRLTYLLRPNVTRPDFRATAALDSPPVTDLDYYSSQIDTESDFISDRETRSDAGESDPEPHPRGPLSVISEALAPSSRRSYSPLGDEPWSISGGSDAEGDKSGSEMELAGETDIHSVRENIVQESSLDSRPHAEPRIVMRNRIWHPCQGRSASSPSRSPARISRRIHVRVDPPRPSKTLPPSFYNYVFA